MGERGLVGSAIGRIGFLSIGAVEIPENKPIIPNDQPITPKPTRRWFHPTPGLLLVFLLAVEGGLLLTERWFPKGWTVLIAVATVGVFLLVMSLWFAC